jgi:hypothetical protein
MSERVESRLAELKRDYRAGEEQLRELVQREVALRETLLRISGAIQVLEELREPGGARDRNPAEQEPGPNGADPLTVG